MKNFTRNGAPPLPHWAELARRKDLRNRPVFLRVLRALQRGTFHFAVEPIYSVPKKTVMFHEILLRLKDESGVSIPPLDVFGTVADNDTSADVGLYLVYYQLLYRNVMNTTASMNISPVLLRTEAERARLWDLLEAYADEGEAHKVILEVLEEPELPITPELITFMKKVKSLGYRWALDDFGDGFLTMDHIRDLPVQFVKLCARYSLRLAANKTPDPTEKLILCTCHKKGITLVAENIRTAEQMRNLHDWHGVSLSQSRAFP